jgi:hypothetical protein
MTVPPQGTLAEPGDILGYHSDELLLASGEWKPGKLLGSHRTAANHKCQQCQAGKPHPA